MSKITRIIGYPSRHIRGRIILPFAVLTLLLAAAGSYLVTNLVSGSLQERFDRQLVETGRVVADGVVRVEQGQLATVRAMSATQGVSEATASGDASGARVLLEPQARNAGVDLAGAVDASGRTLFEAARQGDGSSYEAVVEDAPGAWWPVQRALAGADQSGDKYASLVETSRGFVLVTAAPVYGTSGIVGATFVGTDLQTLVERLKLQSLGDVTVYDYTGAPLATTLITGDADMAALQVASGDLQAVFGAPDATTRSAVNQAERDYDIAYGLLRIRGNVVGVYSTALPTDFLDDAGASTRRDMAVVFGVAISAVLLVGFLISKRITDPILALVRAAARLSEGDVGVRSGIRGQDEIGVLATTFDRMAEGLEEYAARLQRQYLGTVKALTSAIDARDPYTLGHSVRVGQLGRLLGQELGLPEALLAEIEVGGYLHDIGKIGVRDAVLLKPGTLTPEEREAIERHPVIGISILESVEVSPEVREIVHRHHERLDGSGYPDGLSADEQSILVRIAAVADVYDALMTERPYKAAMGAVDVTEILRRQAGPLLDEDVVNALLRVAPLWEERVKTDPALQGLKVDQQPRLDVRRTA